MLIHEVGDHMRMATYALLAVLLLVVLLAPLFGADSRVDEIARRRRVGH